MNTVSVACVLIRFAAVMLIAYSVPSAVVVVAAALFSIYDGMGVTASAMAAFAGGEVLLVQIGVGWLLWARAPTLAVLTAGDDETEPQTPTGGFAFEAPLIQLLGVFIFALAFTDLGSIIMRGLTQTPLTPDIAAVPIPTPQYSESTAYWAQSAGMLLGHGFSAAIGLFLMLRPGGTARLLERLRETEKVRDTDRNLKNERQPMGELGNSE